MTPYGQDANNGNWRTAARWARFLRERFRVILQAAPSADATVAADAGIFLHARRSHAALAAWKARNPGYHTAVVLTGTDLYRDLPDDPDACLSLQLADRLVVLQEDGLARLPRPAREHAEAIFQSAPALPPLRKRTGRVDCLLACHLRAEKDPLTALQAWHWLPAELPIRLRLLGAPLDESLGHSVADAVASDGRLSWPGAWSHGRTRQAIRRAHLLVVPSLMEGGANVVVEAITAGTPVLASRVSGNVGMLGRDYPGLFRAGDARGLARLLRRCLEEPHFLAALGAACSARRPLFSPRRERAAVLALAQALVRGVPR